MSKLSEMLEAQKPPGFSGQHRDPRDPDVMVPKALRTMEDTQPARKIAKGAGFSVEHLKKTWLTCIAFLTCLSLGAGDINKGQTFQAGDTVTHTKLNNLVDLATINTTFFTDKSTATPASADTLLIYSAVIGGFRKTTVGSLFLANSELITSQSEDTSPAAGDFMLSYDVSAASLKKVKFGIWFTNLVQGNLTLVGGQPNIAAPSSTAQYLTFDGGANGSVMQSNLARAVWSQPFTNLTDTATDLLTISNADYFPFYSNERRAMRRLSLNSLMTTPPVLQTSNISSSDLFMVKSDTMGVVATLLLQQLTNWALAEVAWTNQLPTKYVSAEFGVTNGVNAISLNHGLGGMPTGVRWVLVCKTNEIGYVEGDEVDVCSAIDSGSANTHVGYGVSSTNVWLTVNVGGSLRLNNRTNGTITTLSPVVSTVVQNWKWKGYATRLNY